MSLGILGRMQSNESGYMIDPNLAKSIFLAAAEKPAEERAAFLEQATAGNAALRAGRVFAQGR